MPVWLPLSNRQSPIGIRQSAFTLNELLIVIAIIVLMIGLALPAFNVLTGNKSSESATNQISAFLGQARMEAIGVQKTRGVFFFLDKETDRINMAMVQEVFSTTVVTGQPCVFLDLVPDRDFITLPPGIGLQTIDETIYVDATNGVITRNDKYLGFNDAALSGHVPTPSVALYGGVILFDGYGKLSLSHYGLRLTTAADVETAAAVTTSGVYSALGSLLATGGVADVGLTGSSARNFTRFDHAKGQTFQGQYGVVLYDRDGYTTSAPDTDGRDEDWQINSAGNMSGDEVAREAWLAENASHLLVNRYNGTLVKGD